MKKMLSYFLIIQMLIIQIIPVCSNAYAEKSDIINFADEGVVMPETRGGKWGVEERAPQVYADYDFSKNSGNFTTVYGAWTVTSGKYIQNELSPGAAARTLLPEYFSDFTMEFDFTPISDDTKLMLFFGCTSLYEVCVAEIKADGSNIIIGDKEYQGNGHIEKNKNYHVKMISKNGDVTLYLDGEKINEQKNLSFPSGQIGIGCWNSKGEFDNFKVSAPDKLGGGTKLIQSTKEKSEAYIKCDDISNKAFGARISADSLAYGETGIVLMSDGKESGYILGVNNNKAFIRLKKDGRERTLAETDYKALSEKFYDYSALIKGNDIIFTINSTEILRIRNSEISGRFYGIFSNNTPVCCANMGFYNTLTYSEEAQLTDGVEYFNDMDEDYQRECVVLTRLGIMMGYSDSTFRGNHDFTFGELCYAIYKIIGVEPGSSENNSDKSVFEKYTNQAIKDGYASGKNDISSKSAVDSSIMLKALIKILGYAPSDNDAEVYRLSDSIGLTENVKLFGDKINRYNAARLLFNALSAERMKINSGNGGIIKAEKSGCYLKDTFSVEKITGTVIETGFGCADENKPLTLGKDEIRLGDKVLKYGGDCRELLGLNTICYAVLSEDEYDGEVIYIEPYKTKKVIIKSSQILENSDRSRILYYKLEDSKNETSLKLDPMAKIIYNGQFYTLLKCAPDDIFDIKNGTVTLIYNNNSSLPDIIRVDSYINYVVDTVSASNGVIYDKLGNSEIKIDAQNGKFIILKGDKEITVNDIRENDVLSVIAPKSTDAYTVITVSDIEPVRGQLKSKKEDSIVVGRDMYVVSSGIDMTKLSLGESIIVYFDFSNKAAFIKNITSEDYAYLIKAGYNEEDETVYFKMFTFENGKGNFIAQNGINVFFEDKTKNKYSKSNYAGLAFVIDELLSKSKVTDKNDPKKIIRYGMPVRYKMNEYGEIKELRFAQDAVSCDLPERDMEFSCFYDSHIKGETAYYYSGLINSKYRINQGTKILNLSGNCLDIDSYEVVLQGSLRWDDYYDSRIYDVDEEFKAKLLIVENISRGYDLPCSVITDIRTAVDGNDNICTELELYKNGGLNTARATDLQLKCDSGAAHWFKNEGTLLSELKPGDIIAYDVDSDGYIKEFKLIFRYSEGIEYYATSPRGWYWGTIPSTDMTLAYTGITRKTGDIYVFNSNNYSRPVTKNGAAYYICENRKVRPASFDDVKVGDSAAMIWKSAELNTVVVYR